MPRALRMVRPEQQRNLIVVLAQLVWPSRRARSCGSSRRPAAGATTSHGPCASTPVKSRPARCRMMSFLPVLYEPGPEVELESSWRDEELWGRPPRRCRGLLWSITARSRATSPTLASATA
jgi:hypothetical protein